MLTLDTQLYLNNRYKIEMKKRPIFLLDVFLQKTISNKLFTPILPLGHLAILLYHI